MNTQLVSIVIPTFNSARTIAPLLESILIQDYKSIEIIVVDNNSKDNTAEIAGKYTEKIFVQGPERSAQRNRGAVEAKGCYLFFLDSDMKLTARVVSEAVNVMKTNRELLALTVPEKSFGVGFWSACKSLERSFYIDVSWMQAARFFRATAFKDVGGYDEQNTGTEDYDLAQRLEHLYPGCIGKIGELIHHDEGRIRLLHTCRKKYYYAQKIAGYINKPENYAAFSKQSSLLRRYWLFLANPYVLLRNPALSIGMLFMKTCEMTSGALGFIISRFLVSKLTREGIYK